MLSAGRGGRLSFSRKRSLRERRGSNTYRCIAQELPAAASQTLTYVDFHIFVLVWNLPFHSLFLPLSIILLTYPIATTASEVAKQSPKILPATDLKALRAHEERAAKA
jgi:hypothetical protein